MKFILSLIALCTFQTAQSEAVEVEKTVTCAQIAVLVPALIRGEYKETPIWVGATDDQTSVIMFANAKTRTWTLVEHDSKTGCVLASGSQNTFIFSNRSVSQHPFDK